jgi:hypothetical protein|tara:strand:- start:53 stop:211 length:159 start_codon:yes stop_codon:yes gene_type:complete
MQDSLKISQNKDGSFSVEWDKKDPKWNFLNNLTSNEIQTMVENIVKDDMMKS